jgi:branched-chain amino acid transport system substrate-binding protein
VHRRGRPITAPLLLVTALVVGTAACSGDNKAATPATTAATIAPPPATTARPPAAPKFTFGFLAPSAPLLLPTGYAQENALSLAVADINDGGGVLGAPVAATSTDDAAAGSIPNAVTTLVDRGANAVLGPVGSTDVMAALPAMAGAHTLACSGSATVPDLTAATPAAAFYRTVLTDQYTIQYVADHIVEQRDAKAPGGPWKVAIVARGDDYGLSVSSGLASVLNADGVTTTIISYDPNRTSLADQANQAAAFSPNNVVAVTYAEAPRLLDQLVGAGVPASAIIGLDAMFVPNLAQMTFPGAPEKLDGMTVMGVTGDRAFLTRLAALPSGQVIFGPQLYDCAIVIALAAEAAHSADPNVYRQQLNAVLSGTRPCSTYGDCRAKLDASESIAYQGQIGSFTFDARGGPTASRFTTAQLANGRFVVASSVNIDLTAAQAAIDAELALASAVQMARIQQGLTALGLYTGPIDGQPSDALTAAIAALQTQLGLPATGVYDAATDAAFRQRLGNAAGAVNAATASLQQALTDLGLYHGPIDGVYSPATVAAVKSLQASLGVPATGIVDAATLAAVYRRGAASVPPAPPTTTTPPTTPPPTTTPPTTPPPPATTPPTTPPPTTAAPATTAKPPPESTTTTTAAPPGATKNIVVLLAGDARFSTYVSLLREAGLDTTLALLDPVTVFAPTNDAFAALPPGTLDAARADPGKLHDLLYAGMAEGRVTTADLTPGATVTSLAGTPITVAQQGSTITVNKAPLVPPEIDASNGIIHATSAVPTAS